MSYLAIWQTNDGSPLKTTSVKFDEAGNKVGHSHAVATQMAVQAGAVDFEIIKLSDMPAEDGDNLAKNWAFRDAWDHDKTAAPGKIKINTEKARGISLVRVRAYRDEQLLELDKKYTIALRTGGDTAELDIERQLLLDATDAIKALDINGDGFLSVEETAGYLLPLELI